MNIKILQSRFRIKGGHLVSSLDGRRVGSLRGKTHMVMIEGTYYRTEDILAALTRYISEPPSVTVTLDGKYETVTGDAVQLFSDQGPLSAPFIGAVRFNDGWHACMWTLEGTTHNTDLNLKEVST